MWFIHQEIRGQRLYPCPPQVAKSLYFMQIPNTTFSYDSLLWLFCLKLWGFWLPNVLKKAIKHWRLSFKKSVHRWSSYRGRFYGLTLGSINTLTPSQPPAPFHPGPCHVQPFSPQSTRNTPKALLLLLLLLSYNWQTTSISEINCFSSEVKFTVDASHTHTHKNEPFT